MLDNSRNESGTSRSYAERKSKRQPNVTFSMTREDDELVDVLA